MSPVVEKSTGGYSSRKTLSSHLEVLFFFFTLTQATFTCRANRPNRVPHRPGQLQRHTDAEHSSSNAARVSSLPHSFTRDSLCDPRHSSHVVSAGLCTQILSLFLLTQLRCPQFFRTEKSTAAHKCPRFAAVDVVHHTFSVYFWFNIFYFFLEKLFTRGGGGAN